MILLASLAAFGILVCIGVVRLVRELIGKEFFQPPSLSGNSATPSAVPIESDSRALPRP